jgi:hypothetical protein
MNGGEVHQKMMYALVLKLEDLKAVAGVVVRYQADSTWMKSIYVEIEVDMLLPSRCLAAGRGLSLQTPGKRWTAERSEKVWTQRQ